MAKDWITQALIDKAKAADDLYVKTPAFGFGWWFGYFWTERRSNNPQADALVKDALATVFASGFTAAEASEAAPFAVKRAAGDRVAAAFVPPLPEPPDLDANPRKYRQLLLDVMQIGFRELPERPLAGMPEADAREMFEDLIKVTMDGGRRPVALAYRGEARGFDAVVQHRGATPRARLGAVVRMNMEAPWHPFSDPAVASRAYARGTSGDNCLYTVNSVASTLRIPVGFPLIEDPNQYTVPRPRPDGGSDLSSWNYAMLREARLPPPGPQGGHQPLVLAKCRIAGVPGKPSGIFMASENWIYAIRVMSAMHTQQFVEQHFAAVEGQCQERGVGVVALEQYVAGARLRRIHHGAARACGVTGFVQERRFQLGGRWVSDPPTEADLARVHFHDDREAAQQALAAIRDRFGGGEGDDAPKVVRGEVVPAMADVPDLEVLEIEQWDLTIDQLNAHKARLGDRLYWAPFVLRRRAAA